MLKLVFLVLGLAIGFGGGVYWASHNPEAANKLSAEEERRFLETQMQITEKIQSKLDQLGYKAASKPPAAGFVSSGQSAGLTPAEVNDVKADAQKQQAELRKRLDDLKQSGKRDG